MSKAPSESKVIMTAQEVSGFLKIPLSTLYGLSKSGKIRGVKIGKHWRYLEEDVHEYLYRSHPAISMSRDRVMESPVHREPRPPVERRKYSRLNCELGGHFQSLLASQDYWSENCQIRNVCAGGLNLSQQGNGITFHVGDPVQLKFHIPLNGKSVPVKAEGRIVHLDAENRSIGIKFRQMSPEAVEAIQLYVG